MYFLKLIYFFLFFIFFIFMFSLILRKKYKTAASIVFNVFLIEFTILLQNNVLITAFEKL
jgi:hypothetical protein